MQFTETHEWIEIQEGIGTVGVTQFAQKELGDIVYVELPKVGKEVKKGEEAAVLESTKAASDVYTPVSGIITEVNSSLANEPELINSSPQEKGWIFKIKLHDSTETENLMDEKIYTSKLH